MCTLQSLKCLQIPLSFPICPPRAEYQIGAVQIARTESDSLIQWLECFLRSTQGDLGHTGKLMINGSARIQLRGIHVSLMSNSIIPPCKGNVTFRKNHIVVIW